MTVDYRVGDTREVTAGIPDGSISLVATSPPFLALRSYLPADHEAKGAEIGSEATPAAFLDTLLALTAEWGRVLAPWGSIAIELGDTYAGSGGAGGDYSANGLRAGQQAFTGSAKRLVGSREHRPERDGTGADGGERLVPMNGGAGWPRPKCLALIPQLYAIALAYGINPLTGAPSPAGQWRVRNVIVWHRPNPAVGALGDKVRPSTSYITVATRSAKRWFDLDAVRTELDPTKPRVFGGVPGGRLSSGDGAAYERGERKNAGSNPAGAPPLDCWFDEHDTWTITTQPSRLAHYAMWPAKLAERLILMMCPEWVCSQCGEPRRRQVHLAASPHPEATRTVMRVNARNGPPPGPRTSRDAATLGWSDCGHGGQWKPGVVLDPFCGTGSTMAAAEFHRRDAIGVDLDVRNRALYPARRDEVFRALNPTHVTPIAGQQDLFGGAA